MVRAAKLQEEEPDSDLDAYTPGITLDELKRMAKELGVEERYLEKALQKEIVFKSESEEKSRKRFLGVDFTRDYETIIDGELPPTHFDVVIEDLGSSSNSAGRSHYSIGTTQVGRTVKGSITAGLGMGQFTMTSRHGRTRLHVRSSAFVPFMAIAYPMSIISLIAGLVSGEKGGVPAWAVLSIVLGGICLGLTIAGLVSKIGHQKLKEKFDSIAAKVEEETHLLRENLRSNVTVSESESEGIEDRLKH